jgi:protease II
MYFAARATFTKLSITRRFTEHRGCASLAHTQTSINGLTFLKPQPDDGSLDALQWEYIRLFTDIAVDHVNVVGNLVVLSGWSDTRRTFRLMMEHETLLVPLKTPSAGSIRFLDYEHPCVIYEESAWTAAAVTERFSIDGPFSFSRVQNHVVHGFDLSQFESFIDFAPTRDEVGVPITFLITKGKIRRNQFQSSPRPTVLVC